MIKGMYLLGLRMALSSVSALSQQMRKIKEMDIASSNPKIESELLRVRMICILSESIK